MIDVSQPLYTPLGVDANKFYLLHQRFVGSEMHVLTVFVTACAMCFDSQKALKVA